MVMINIVKWLYFAALQAHTRICLPVPLYHCFGSVGGGMCMAVHGNTLVFPSSGYDGRASLAAVESERWASN